MTPTFRELDTAVLTHDVPSADLRAGDLGAIVHVHAPDRFEVEFVTAAGRTQALLTLTAADLRPVAENDLLAVRPTTSRRGTA